MFSCSSNVVEKKNNHDSENLISCDHFLQENILNVSALKNDIYFQRSVANDRTLCTNQSDFIAHQYISQEISTIEKRIIATRKLVRFYWKNVRSHLTEINLKKVNTQFTIIKHLQNTLYELQTNYYQQIVLQGEMYRNQIEKINDDVKLNKESLNLKSEHQKIMTRIVKLYEENQIRHINFVYLEKLYEQSVLTELQYLYYFYLNLADHTMRYKKNNTAMQLLRHLNSVLSKYIKTHFQSKRQTAL